MPFINAKYSQMNMQYGRVGLENERKGRQSVEALEKQHAFSFCRTQGGKMAGPHIAHNFSQVHFSLGKNVPYLSDGASYIKIRITVSN